MELFPTKELRFVLLDTKVETIDRLTRRTELSESKTAAFTDKSFRGVIDGDTFSIISSEVGIGALCVMNGKIEGDKGYVAIQINKPFRILFAIILFMPVLAIVLGSLKNPSDIPFLFLVGIAQVVIIRFFFIGLFFSKASRQSLNRLRDVLDIDYIK
jgi:hypothetical protein